MIGRATPWQRAVAPRKRMRRRLGRARLRAAVLGLLAAVVVALPAIAAVSATAADQDTKPAASVRDLRDYFASCFHPPGIAANTRVTFYFSLNNRGGLIGHPRTTWLGFTGAEADKAKQLMQFTDAFDRCLPVSLDPEMAAAVPGEVYYLQYVVGPDGHDQQVLLRPFGSHGGGGGAIGRGVGPAPGPAGEPGPVGPTIPPFRAFRPQPGEGPFFNPPIIVPFGRRR